MTDARFQKENSIFGVHNSWEPETENHHFYEEAARDVDLLQALELMKQGARMVLPRSGMLARIAPGEEKVRLSSRSCFLQISQEDFLSLFSGQPCIIHTGADPQADQAESEQRDQEYYAWRREKQ